MKNVKDVLFKDEVWLRQFVANNNFQCAICGAPLNKNLVFQHIKRGCVELTCGESCRFRTGGMPRWLREDTSDGKFEKPTRNESLRTLRDVEW